MWPPRRGPWRQTERQRGAKEEEAAPAKQEPSANIYWCQSRSACGGLFLAAVGPVPTTHNTKALDPTDSLSVEISLNQTSVLTSQLRGHPELCTHTSTNKNTRSEEIQEVINNRLFSQDRKKFKEARSSGNLWNPSTCDTSQPFIMSAVVVSRSWPYSVPLPLPYFCCCILGILEYSWSFP